MWSINLNNAIVNVVNGYLSNRSSHSMLMYTVKLPGKIIVASILQLCNPLLIFNVKFVLGSLWIPISSEAHATYRK